jgi:ribosomal protein S18 acetylase RimI-like enzyme
MILPFTKKYLAELLVIFEGNIPEYFDITEKPQFNNYLHNEPNNYFVSIDKGKVNGAGGFAFESPQEGRIVWLLVDRKIHGKGIGRELMEHFESEIKENQEVKLISLMTSQHTDKFYERLDYKTTRIENDYWAKGMHLYYMEKELN